jgi:transcriptional regulator with XRE-family HTH domain
MTQRALAEAASRIDDDIRISGSAISYWETGDTTPTQPNLEAVVKALGLTMAQFYGRVPRTKKSV